MPCYYPVRGFQHLDGGQLVFGHNVCEPSSVPVDHREVVVPCGRCFGCRLERSKMWACRCLHEAKMSDVSSFVTLTYDDGHLPINGSLNYKHYQDFMKRLRKWYPEQVRFYMCGEYGEETWRPHFHALLFGVHFGDRKKYKLGSNGDQLYSSVDLDRIWGFGQCLIGDVTFESAAYIARYVMKKVNGDRALEHYTRMSQFGEIVQLTPEFAHMSLKPGIGARWFAKFKSEIFANDNVVIRGKEFKPPRYYDKLMEIVNGDDWEDMKFRRCQRPINWEDHTEERLRVREFVAKSKKAFLRDRFQ